MSSATFTVPIGFLSNHPDKTKGVEVFPADMRMASGDLKSSQVSPLATTVEDFCRNSRIYVVDEGPDRVRIVEPPRGEDPTKYDKQAVMQVGGPALIVLANDPLGKPIGVFGGFDGIKCPQYVDVLEEAAARRRVDESNGGGRGESGARPITPSDLRKLGIESEHLAVKSVEGSEFRLVSFTDVERANPKAPALPSLGSN